MSGEFDAAGNLANAGLIGGAIEGREPREAGEGNCANCGAPIVGRFCPQCGQATYVHRKVWQLFTELLFNLFSFDTKLWRTLPMVLLRPGTLTYNYVHGHRARYISPLTLFLFCIFLLFFSFSFVQTPPLDLNENRGDAVQNLNEAQNDLREAQQELARAQAHPDPDEPRGLGVRLAQQAVDRAERAVARRQAALRRFDHINQPLQVNVSDDQQNVTLGGAQTNTAVHAPAPPTASTTTVTATTSSAGPPGPPQPPAPANADQTWQQQVADAARSGRLRPNTGWPALDQRLIQDALNPDLALYKIGEAASRYTFLLVPLSLPFIWLMFIWKRGLTLYDHTVFALYGLSFAALLFIAATLTSQIPFMHWATGVLPTFGLPIHTFFHLGGAYKLKWWSALWRTFFMMIFALIVISLYAALIIILGLAG